MRAIILAAGRGRRLEPVLSGTPKCLLEFGGRPLVDYQIEAFRYAGIEELVIVVGYEQQQVRTKLRGYPVSTVFIENPLYDTTNTLYSLWLAREYFDESFFYANGDVLFDYRLVERLVAGKTGFACVRGGCGAEEVKVVVNGDRILEIGKQLAGGPCFGEFVGVARFERDDNALFASILSRCAEDTANWNRYFEYAADILARSRPLYAVDVSDLPAVEIDFPEDLRRAREQVLPLLARPGGP